MATGQEGLNVGAEVRLPPPPTVLGARDAWTLPELAKQLQKTCQDADISLKPFKISLPPELEASVQLFQARLPDPVDPSSGEVDHVVVVSVEPWGRGSGGRLYRRDVLRAYAQGPAVVQVLQSGASSTGAGVFV
jgi:hypothetical protein